MSEDLCTKCSHERRFHNPDLSTNRISKCGKCNCDGFNLRTRIIGQVPNSYDV